MSGPDGLPPILHRPASGRPPGRLGRAWRSVRPTTRRGALLAALSILGGSAVLSVAFLIGAAMAWSPYLETDLHPDANPKMWAGLELTFAGGGQCAECHEAETAKAASARHAGISCESCHGALLEHVEGDAAPPAATIRPVLPTDSVCIRCHSIAIGRPASQLQIDPAGHYAPVCLQCHDPHTGISRRPPVVLHPLVDLPPCVTCHGPEGFKARSQRHPVVDGDEPCLACHGAGRGPEPRS